MDIKNVGFNSKIHFDFINMLLKNNEPKKNANGMIKIWPQLFKKQKILNFQF